MLTYRRPQPGSYSNWAQGSGYSQSDLQMIYGSEPWTLSQSFWSSVLRDFQLPSGKTITVELVGDYQATDGFNYDIFFEHIFSDPDTSNIYEGYYDGNGAFERLLIVVGEAPGSGAYGSNYRRKGGFHYLGDRISRKTGTHTGFPPKNGDARLFPSNTAIGTALPELIPARP